MHTSLPLKYLLQQPVTIPSLENYKHSSALPQANALVTAVIGKGLFEIMLNQQKIQVFSPQKLKPGQEVQIQFKDQKKMNEVTILSKAINHTTTQPKTDIENLLQARQKLMRQSLPLQRPLLPALKSVLSHVKQPVSNESSHLKTQARTDTIQSIQHLLNHIVKSEKLIQSAFLKQAFRQSGLFSEALLRHNERASQNRELLNKDLKVQIQRILSTLEPLASSAKLTQTVISEVTDRNQLTTARDNAHKTETHTDGVTPKLRKIMHPEFQTPAVQQNKNAVEIKPSSNNPSQAPTQSQDHILAQDLKSILAYIQLNQQKAIALEQSTPLWHSTIPVLDNNDLELINMEIEKKAQKSMDEVSRWSISLELNLQRLGLVQANVSLTGLQLSISLWAENTTTQSLLEINIKALEQMLSQVGFNSQSISLLKQPIEKGSTPRDAIALVDEKL